MIRVRVHINDKEIIDVHAVRENIFRGMSKHHKYDVYITWGCRPTSDEHLHIGELMHKYSLGASRLSVRMLRTYYQHLDRATK